MAQVIWSRPALADLSRLHDFLKSKNPEAARRAVAAIRQSIAILAENPLAGRPAFDVLPGVRDQMITFGAAGYVARYRSEGDVVLILRIRHIRETGF